MVENNIKLTKSVIKDFLTNSVQLLEPSLNIANFSDKELAFHLAILLEQEESLQTISEDIKQISPREIKQDSFNLNFIFYTVSIKCFENILSSIIEYMEYESDQENHLSRQIGIIDFENYPLLQNQENLNIFNLFSNSRKSLIGSALLGNFPQFCVSIAKKIEVLIDAKIDQKLDTNTSGEKYVKTKKLKLQEFIKKLEIAQNKSSNFYKSHQDTIEYIYDVRDCECHFDELGLSFEEKANQLYWIIQFRLDNLRPDLAIDPMPIQETFEELLPDYAKTRQHQKEERLKKNGEREIYIKSSKLFIYYNTLAKKRV